MTTMMIRSINTSARRVSVAPCRLKSTLAAATTTTMEDDTKQDHPTLVRVSKLPIIGSMNQTYSGLPVPHSQTRVLEFWPAMRAKFGEFYEIGIPGLGQGITGTAYIIQDPNEMASILRQEGKYPSGAVEFSWALGKFFRDRNLAIGGLLNHGPEWKRIRRFVQSDLLSPAAGARYVPAILEGAEIASRGAPYFSDNLNEYLGLASFDMFSNVLMGHLPKVSDPTSHSDPKDVEFCRNVTAALKLNSEFMVTAMEGILNAGLGIKTKKYKEYENSWDKAVDYAMQKVRELHQRRLDNTLNEKERDSYANMAYDRQATELEDKSANPAEFVQLNEVESIVGGLLSAGVDTTGGMLSFKLLHIASSPLVQDKLYHELQPTLVNSKLTADSLKLPYLNEILRESHRIASSAQTVPIKTLQVDRPVHGHPLPKGSVVMLDSYSTGQQQEHFEDPVGDFVPERFSREIVAARKGTRHQVVDHAFFNGPFSQGARKCPGSRVANLEAHALVAQWVLDWKMELPQGLHVSQVPYDLETVTTSHLPSITFAPRQH